MDLEIASELNGYNTDKYNFPKERERYSHRLAFLLKGEMGQDIKDVINGKKQVKLSFKEKLHYKWKNILNNIAKMFIKL